MLYVNDVRRYESAMNSSLCLCENIHNTYCKNLCDDSIYVSNYTRVMQF